jgi:hypothetical protein
MFYNLYVKKMEMDINNEYILNQNEIKKLLVSLTISGFIFKQKTFSKVPKNFKK